MSSQESHARRILSRPELELELARIAVRLREGDLARRIAAREDIREAKWLYGELETLASRVAPEHASYFARRVEGIASQLTAVNLWQGTTAQPVDNAENEARPAG
ncbi:MAG: hypothetical protein AVDCRST_MAG71-1141 [uncultured Lysobacter sp.]|uniref:Uncharacterized protein n=1 Tax=uncultured Lysobacter sp. TaxID=271060 RepID=A0A6J4KZ84_9GAMM|nr:MAG: hypothetical protein AVDCRST_MAG71-1141 [uncultured Lysobacter sp.]